MIKQFIHKAISFFLAVIVLFSSFSFTVYKHICGEEVTGISYVEEVNSCEVTLDKCDIYNSPETEMQKENCCNEVHELIQGNQNEQQALQNLEIPQMQFIVAFVYSYIDLFEEISSTTFYKDYSPPLIDKDIRVLYQTFLI